jgi:hypothetical protein
MKLENYKSDEPCIACNESRDGYVCFHHLNSRGSGGSDNEWNLMPLCSKHHTEIHKIGLLKFISKYPEAHIGAWLRHRGWEFVAFINKWIRPVES